MTRWKRNMGNCECLRHSLISRSHGVRTDAMLTAASWMGMTRTLNMENNGGTEYSLACFSRDLSIDARRSSNGFLVHGEVAELICTKIAVVHHQLRDTACPSIRRACKVNQSFTD